MAKKNPSVLGEPRGKIGDVVYKERNGKIYISRAPKPYNISQLPHEIKKRNIQKVSGKFCSAVNSNLILRAIWYKEKGTCENAFNKISQVNYHLCEPGSPSAKAQITPGGFKLEAEEISMKAGSIEITPHPTKLHKEEAVIFYILILSLSTPKRRSKKTNDFEFLLLDKYQEEGPKLIFTLDKENTDLAKKYKNKTLFLAAVTMNEKGSISRWSETLGRII